MVTCIICRLTEEIRKSSGALHTGRDPANQSLEQSSGRRKSRFEHQNCSVLSVFSFLPSHMSPDHLQVCSGVILQTNKTLAYFPQFYYFSVKVGEPEWQFEQVAKLNTETENATSSGTSVMHWLSVFHMWKLVSLRSDICISVKASRDAELRCTAWPKKVSAES